MAPSSTTMALDFRWAKWDFLYYFPQIAKQEQNALFQEDEIEKNAN